MSDSGQSTEYLFQGYRLNVQGKCLIDPEGNPVQLSHRALETLILLIRNRGKTLSKTHLIESVWPDVYVEENNLSQAITSIRKALGDNKQTGRFIKTFKGKGYCFVADVKQVNDIRHRRTGKEANGMTGKESGVLSALASLRMTPFFGAALSLGLVLLIAVLLLEIPGRSQQLASPADRDIAVPVVPAIPGSMAVLPLTTLNPDAENKVLALGMHLELINRLSRVEDLKLISHNGVPVATIQDQPLTELGRLLNVEYIVTGSILLLDDNARINLYLLEADTGVILWTDNYEVDTDNLNGTLPSRIALDIAAAMDVRVSENNRLAVQENATDSFAAYRYHLASVSAFSAMDFAKAWSLTRQALELDPEYLDALQMFSRVNSVLSSTPLQGMTSADHISLALSAAEQSINHDPNNQRGYMLKAVALGSGSQWHEAMAELEKLHAMNAPLSSLQFLAPILMSLGHFDQAVEILEANLREEPINLYARGFLLEALEMSGHRMQSRLEYELGEELNPEWWGDTVNVFLALGRKESIRDIDGLQDISEDTKQVLWNLNEGNLDAVRQALAVYTPTAGTETVELIYYSAMAAYSGNLDQSVELMGRAVSEVGLNIHWAWLPVFDEARKREGFKALLRKAGLVDYWREHGWPPYCQPANDTFSCDAGAYDLISMQ